MATINLPAERCKNGHAHTVHLVRARRRAAYRSERGGRALRLWRGKGGFQGYCKCKNALDAKLNFDKAWRIHDIRRSVATHMAEIGILPHIIEATLNHLSGHKSGIAGVYNRATYDDAACCRPRQVGEPRQADPGTDALGAEPRDAHRWVSNTQICGVSYDGAAFEPPFLSTVAPGVRTNAGHTIPVDYYEYSCV